MKPILVERLTATQATRLRCDHCRHERECDVPDELNQEDCYDCDNCGKWAMHFKYVEAPACGNCGKRGFWDVDGTGDGYCSRVCKLQDEYAQTKAAA